MIIFTPFSLTPPSYKTSKIDKAFITDLVCLDEDLVSQKYEEQESDGWLYCFSQMTVVFSRTKFLQDTDFLANSGKHALKVIDLGRNEVEKEGEEGVS